MSKDDLGDRMKSNYENRTRHYLPRRTYSILRVDGKAFHTYTRDCERPFDYNLMSCMDEAGKGLCEQISGATLAYIQSDEISVLITDFNKPGTEAWFDGNIQKISSVAASIATAVFNQANMRAKWRDSGVSFEEVFNFACFDARVFTIPDRVEVNNYFYWRQKDWMRNSVSMVARSFFSHKDLAEKTIVDMKQMIISKGQDWGSYSDATKYGRVVFRKEEEKDIEFTKASGEIITAEGVKRKYWNVESAPIFTQERNYLNNMIPIL